jgi:hypothetical protein
MNIRQHICIYLHEVGHYVVELLRQERCTTVCCLVLVRRVVLEKLTLMVQSSADGLFVLDISLTTVDDGNVAKTKVNDTASENVHDIRARVHQVNLSQHTDRTLTLGVNLPRHLESIRVRKISVSGSHGEDDTRRLGDEAQQHITDLLLNVAGLVSHGHLCETGKVDQSQGEDFGAEDAQVDGLRRDACVLARLGLGVAYDLGTDFVEIVELLVGKVQEFTPFLSVGGFVVLLGLGERGG